MKKAKLKNFVSVEAGISKSKIEARCSTILNDYYDIEAFQEDYFMIELIANEKQKEKNKEFLLKLGDVVINVSTHLAAIVSQKNVGKIFTNNFIRVRFTNVSLDSGYFLYLFNSYSEVKRQKLREVQGTNASQRIPIKSLEELEIPILPLETQRVIAKAYAQSVQLQKKLKDYGEHLEQMTSLILEENMANFLEE
ncbi:Type I restriction modification DNA specificity domain-containing protein [Pilibacter termitis]|uniref:Type I restriction modification DNA specificity domain-containing protein n=1 Tax=Pilibacter termitis TaxID=263852 RepID=A0A1T4MFM8_9ENTE|nr:restriction endonuclease subunit S [Pilibacter termitis]SJZ65880.1 Type I restriction modification DNA specificity domain-containing protein [Pilibacter termitis]